MPSLNLKVTWNGDTLSKPDYKTMYLSPVDDLILGRIEIRVQKDQELAKAPVGATVSLVIEAAKLVQVTPPNDSVIVIDPAKFGGKPSVRGVVTVEGLTGWIQAGEEIRKILKQYPTLTEADINAAVAYGEAKKIAPTLDVV